MSWKRQMCYFSHFWVASMLAIARPKKRTKKLALGRLKQRKKQLCFEFTKRRLNHGGKSNPLHESTRILIFAHFSPGLVATLVNSEWVCLSVKKKGFVLRRMAVESVFFWSTVKKEMKTGKVTRIQSGTSWSSFFSFSVCGNSKNS